jgi:hypothetical protein
MSIPKVIFQTSKNKRPLQHIIKMIKNKSPEWHYIHFTDLEIIKFFINNPIEEFSNIIQKFKSIKCGAHKADLFRYYFIYIKGGVFIDDDAMLQYDMNYISSDYDFFSVNSSYCPGCIFQGLIGAVPQNEIIYAALKDCYNINNKNLNEDYLLGLNSDALTLSPGRSNILVSLCKNVSSLSGNISAKAFCLAISSCSIFIKTIILFLNSYTFVKRNYLKIKFQLNLKNGRISFVY